MTKRIMALLLAVLLLCSTVVVSTNAEDGKLIGIEVAYRDGGALKTKEEIFFTDGSCLYASIDCLNAYTLYNYDKENSAFVRIGQNYKDALSKVDIHPDKKIATATMFGQTTQVKLADVVKEKNDVYLPLAQMAALLKATLAVKDNVLYFCNSGISIADAAYNYSPKKDVLTVSALAHALYGKKEEKKQT